jgi:heme-degrading monooxygenase HmoA
VKPGQEDDFVRAWRELADRTKSDFPNETASLVRDREQPNQFISFGPWDSLEQIEKWRSSTTFQEGVGKIRELLDDFELTRWIWSRRSTSSRGGPASRHTRRSGRESVGPAATRQAAARGLPQRSHWLVTALLPPRWKPLTCACMSPEQPAPRHR